MPGIVLASVKSVESDRLICHDAGGFIDRIRIDAMILHIALGARYEESMGGVVDAMSAVLIAFFMRWLGDFEWWKVVVVSVGNSVFFFLVFEVWFKIPLPKGPLEALLRIN